MIVGATLLAAGLAWPAVLSAERKVAPTLYDCPPDAPERAVDHDGLQDVCARRTAPVCPAGTTLTRDAEGTVDRCLPPPARRAVARGRRPAGKASAAPPPSVATVPACPTDMPLLTRPGADVCERTAAPVCPTDFAIEAHAGEDRCVHGAKKAKK